MDTEVTCPSCGEESSLDRKYDAWASFEVLGVDTEGELILSKTFDTQMFDSNKIECSSCGAEFGEKEIREHLRAKSSNTQSPDDEKAEPIS
jgi:ribosomal protein L37E